MERSLYQQSQVEVARETLAEIERNALGDVSQAAYMVGRLEVSLRALLAIVDGEVAQ